MKSVIIGILLTTSLTAFNANAMQVAGVVSVGSSLYASTILQSLCNLAGDCKEAIQIIEDAQYYGQNGEFSILLDQKINELMISNQNISKEDALDLVIENALNNIK